MSNITTKIKDYRILFKDDRDPVYITEKTYDAIWDDIANWWKDNMIRLQDEDWKLLFSGRVWQIKEVEQCKPKQTPNSRGICPYGITHDINDKGSLDCHCRNIYWESFEFTKWIYSNYNIKYDYEINDTMRLSYMKSKKTI